MAEICFNGMINLGSIEEQVMLDECCLGFGLFIMVDVWIEECLVQVCGEDVVGVEDEQVVNFINVLECLIDCVLSFLV